MKISDLVRDDAFYAGGRAKGARKVYKEEKRAEAEERQQRFDARVWDYANGQQARLATARRALVRWDNAMRKVD